MADNEITYEQFLEMKRRFDAAENDTTPFAVVDDEEIKVVGDVNNTEIKKADYVIQFGYPNRPEFKEAIKDEKIIGETENYIGVERTYKDAWISPRRFTDIQATLVQLYKFFNVVTEDGTVRDLTPDETLLALREMNGEMVDAMCSVVGSVLGIPKEEEEYILLPSAIMASMKIAEDFPEVVNGVNFSTLNSSVMR